MWDQMRSDVERAIDSELGSCDLMPFDAASETPIEEQKYFYILLPCAILCLHLVRFSAMAKTRELLRDGKYSESIALVRAARYISA